MFEVENCEEAKHTEKQTHIRVKKVSKTVDNASLTPPTAV